MRAFLLVLAFAWNTAFAAATASGTLNFTSFAHNADANAATQYEGFTFGAAWFDNPKIELRDPYITPSTNGGSRSTIITRADLSPFILESFTYGGRSSNGVAYISIYGTNGQTLYSSQAVNDKIQFLSPLDAPGGQTFNVATQTGVTSPILGFAFSFKTGGGGLGDQSDANQFLFDNLKYSGATIQAAPVPEPSAWLMLLAGTIALVFKARRNRQP